MPTPATPNHAPRHKARPCHQEDRQRRRKPAGWTEAAPDWLYAHRARLDLAQAVHDRLRQDRMTGRDGRLVAIMVQEAFLVRVFHAAPELGARLAAEVMRANACHDAPAWRKTVQGWPDEPVALAKALVGWFQARAKEGRDREAAFFALSVPQVFLSIIREVSPAVGLALHEQWALAIGYGRDAVAQGEQRARQWEGTLAGIMGALVQQLQAPSPSLGAEGGAA